MMPSQPPAVTPSVLIVDDVAANRVALAAVLKPLQVNVVEASSGAEAVQQVRCQAFAVVLLDVQMPEMDGFETARQLHALPNGREVPIVFVTAIHGDEAYAKRGYESGGADYITKPFDIDVVRARVRAFVNLFRQREEAHRARFESQSRELSEAHRRLEAFERISTAALETDDTPAFLHTLLTVFIGAADSADTATILLREGDALRARASIGLVEEVEGGFTIAVGQGFAGAIAETRAPLLLVGDEIAHKTVSPWLKRGDLRALYGVPLMYEGEVIGVAHIGSTRAQAFSDGEMRLFRAMAERASWVVSRQRARDRLYALLEAAPAAISVWSVPDYTCEYANAEYRRSQAGREPVGQTHVQQGATPEVVALFDQVVRTGRSACIHELPLTWDWKGGGTVEQRFFDLTLLPQRYGAAHPDAVIAFSIDLTESVRARKVVESARREAEIASRAKDEFLATVSHELRTPLNAILGWTASARRGAVRDMDRALATVERSARAQARIIDDVLDLSRIASGKLRLDIAPADLLPALFGAVEAVRPAAEAKGVTLDVGVDDNLGVVAADVDRLQQVFWNLLSNAVKFTPSGGRVQLEATRAGATLVVRVTDTGEGIAADFLPHVFDPFRQADGSTTRRHGGLGLGLAIVKQLVQAHGGTVRAESDGPGKGSSFVTELPARTIPALRLWRAHNDAAESWSRAAAVRLDDVRVLLVDDEEDARQLAREVLAGHGAVVEEASSAHEALQKLGTFKPDVMVSDIAMPSADGFSLIGRVRKLPPELGGQTPAIALTAYTLAEDRDRALAAGFQLHVPKPVDPLQLVSHIADLGTRRRVARS